MKRGFTLIELLIVVAILAILAVAAIIVLNPAQLLAQARDVQRINDLGAIKSAVALYLTTTTSSPALSGYTVTVASGTCPFTGGACATNASTTVDGTGWVKANLTQTTGGSPLASLPLDPLQNSTYYYAYGGENTNFTYEIDGRLESTKYRDIMKNDGGDKSACTTYTGPDCFYEVGTSLTL